jgi:hypothetical protein
VGDPLAVDLLRDAGLAAVEQQQGFVDGGADRAGGGGRNVGAGFPGGFDLGLEVSEGGRRS